MRKLAFVAIAATIFSSCATIFGNTQRVFGIDTEPKGANVEIVDRHGKTVYQGQTPVTKTLKNSAGFFKRATYTVKLSMDGYQPKTIVLDAHLNGWYFGNLLIGGVLGMLIIDPATGAMYTFSNADTQLDEKLTPLSTSDVPVLKVIELKDVPADRRRDLVKLP
jgi:hypothetical protein